MKLSTILITLIITLVIEGCGFLCNLCCKELKLKSSQEAHFSNKIEYIISKVDILDNGIPIVQLRSPLPSQIIDIYFWLKVDNTKADPLLSLPFLGRIEAILREELSLRGDQFRFDIELDGSYLLIKVSTLSNNLKEVSHLLQDILFSNRLLSKIKSPNLLSPLPIWIMDRLGKNSFKFKWNPVKNTIIFVSAYQVEKVRNQLLKLWNRMFKTSINEITGITTTQKNDESLYDNGLELVFKIPGITSRDYHLWKAFSIFINLPYVRGKFYRFTGIDKEEIKIKETEGEKISYIVLRVGTPPQNIKELKRGIKKFLFWLKYDYKPIEVISEIKSLYKNYQYDEEGFLKLIGRYYLATEKLDYYYQVKNSIEEITPQNFYQFLERELRAEIILNNFGLTQGELEDFFKNKKSELDKIEEAHNKGSYISIDTPIGTKFILVKEKKETKKCNWGLIVNGGTLLEPKSMEGAAYLIQNYLAEYITERLDKFYNRGRDSFVKLTPVLNYDYIGWKGDFSSSQEGVLELILDAILFPEFISDYVKKTKQKLIELILEEQNYKLLLHLLSLEILYKDHRYTTPLYGRLESLSEISPSNLEKLHALIYTKKLITIMFSGDCNFELLRRKLILNYGIWEDELWGVEELPYMVPKVGETGIKLTKENEDPSSARAILLTFPINTKNLKEEISIDIIILLLKELFSKKSFEINRFKGRWGGYISMYLEIEDPYSSFEEVTRDIYSLCVGTIDQKLFDSVKQKLKLIKLTTDRKGPDILFNFLIKNITHDPYYDYERYIEQLEKITIYDIKEVACNYIKDENSIEIDLIPNTNTTNN